ncbi:MAG: rhomboid family intramembrane serine protease, partial [Bacteroidetes bacterium]|nr:rhomboid family intramembrane serine protease [Bacteroidota bacterium]
TMGPAWDARLTELFGLHDVHSIYFRPHQVITYAFLHGGWEHVLFNMLGLWMFGAMLENHWGGKRFLIFYVVSAIGAAIVHLTVLYFEMGPIMEQLHTLPLDAQQEYLTNPGFPVNSVTVGASGAIFGCLAAMAWLFPNQYIYLNFIFPIKIKWFALGYGLLELFSGTRATAGDNVAHWAHLGGGLVGLLLVLYWNKTDRRNFY